MVRTEVATGSSEQLESYSEVTKVPFSDTESPENVEAYGHWPDYDMFGYDVVEQQCNTILPKNRVVVFMDARFNRIAQLKLAMYLRNIKTSSLVLRPTRK
ncbi:hypothetical protein CMK14_07350 [Candidatus Poribacteria bacterium]|nr:hypothetical protein [Candidatus Poribacteria bacterium]